MERHIYCSNSCFTHRIGEDRPLNHSVQPVSPSFFTLIWNQVERSLLFNILGYPTSHDALVAVFLRVKRMKRASWARPVSLECVNFFPVGFLNAWYIFTYIDPIKIKPWKYRSIYPWGSESINVSVFESRWNSYTFLVRYYMTTYEKSHVLREHYAYLRERYIHFLGKYWFIIPWPFHIQKFHAC